MSTRVIKLPSATSKFQQVTILDGVPYTFVFRWNQRSGHFFLTIRDASGADIVTGRKIVASNPFAAHETNADMPPGAIWVIDVDGTGIDPGLRELGDRVILMYVDEDNVG